jgi:predicted metal-dependent phosphoesterase TrpH
MSLDAFQQPGQFHRGNLHTHSTLSDGMRAPEAVCAHYRESGYDFLALTDHFQKRFGYPIADTERYRTNRFTTILGAELHAPANSHGEIWHILAVGLPADFAPTGECETGPELARRAVDAGAYVAIAHPHWSGLTLDDGRALAAAQAIEVYNHTCELECRRGDGSVLLDALLNEGRRIDAIATDDAHFRVDDAGGGFVMVKAEANEPQALLEALKRGHFYASQGPLIHAAEIVGGDLHLSCSPVVNAAVVGRGSAKVNQRGAELTQLRVPLAKFEGDWCRVVITDAAGRAAWTNPIWLSPGAPAAT